MWKCSEEVEIMQGRKLRNMPLSDRLFYVFNGLFWVIVMFIVIYPLYLVCISSVSDPDAVAAGKVLWKPVDVSLMGYKAIFNDKQLWIGYANSLIYTVVSVVISIFVTKA